MDGFPSLRGREFSSAPRKLRLSKARICCCIAVVLFSLTLSFSKESAPDWAARTLQSLSLREKIAQLIQIRVPGKFINRNGTEFLALKDQICENRVGGVVLFAGNVYESAMLLNELQGLSKVPLLVAADFERGLSFRIADTTSFPWTMAFGAAGSESYSYEQGLITGQESRALGVHWIFAPVVDVNNNPDNPVINIRSFGEDPELVARLGSAFIRGARKGGVLTTAKHFPGHGDTSTDSHLALPVVESGLDRLQAIEFRPFQSAIEAGVDSIMTAHVAVPNVTDSPEIPATLSPRILTDLLRNRLNFKGLVVTDALEMGGITNTYWGGLAAVRALQAGADVLLLPPNATVAINEVERAVKRGDISEKRIDESVLKVLAAKNRMGLPENRAVPLRKIGDVVASPKSARLAQEVADRSITVVRDDRHLLPINPLSNKRLFSLVLTADLDSSPGTAFHAELRKHFLAVRTAWGNARTTGELLAGLDKEVAETDLIVFSTIARLSSGQDTIAVPRNQQAILKKLLASGKPLLWVAFGNPYVLRIAPEVGTYLCTFSYSDVSQIAAAKALAGEIAVSGRMPVSLPGISKPGDGLQIPKLQMTLKETTSAGAAGQFEKARKDTESAVDAGVFAGAELLVGYRGSLEFEYRTGKSAFASNSPPVTSATVYGLASLSRPVATASAAMLAIDSGILISKDLVSDYLPEAKDYGKLRIQEILTAKDLQSRAPIIEEILARASGSSIERYLAKGLFDPLATKSMKQQKTGSGLLCRGRDLAVFAQMMLNRGMYDHRRLFKPETVSRFTGAQGLWTKPAGLEWARNLFSASAFGYASDAGPVLWIDPDRQLFVILLTTAINGKIEEAQKAIIESAVRQIANYE
jgi:beta-N-acetylhexosaminidase